MRKAATAIAILGAACSPAAPAPSAPATTEAPPEPTAPAPTTTVAPATTAPTTVPTTAAAPEGAGSAVEPSEPTVASGDVEAAICTAWGDECGPAVAVARCESGLRPEARNGNHAGLFQVNVRIHAGRIARMGYTTAQMFEAEPNIAVAHALWAEQGWRPWTCAA